MPEIQELLNVYQTTSRTTGIVLHKPYNNSIQNKLNDIIAISCTVVNKTCTIV